MALQANQQFYLLAGPTECNILLIHCLLCAGERFLGPTGLPQPGSPSSPGAHCPSCPGIPQPWHLSGSATHWRGCEWVVDQGPRETKPKLGVGLAPCLWEVTQAPCSFSPPRVSLFSVLIVSISFSCLISCQPYWLCIETQVPLPMWHERTSMANFNFFFCKQLFLCVILHDAKATAWRVHHSRPAHISHGETGCRLRLSQMALWPLRHVQCTNGS